MKEVPPGPVLPEIGADQPPFALLARDLISEQAAQLAYKTRFIGAAATSEIVECDTPADVEGGVTLAEALSSSLEGDEDATGIVRLAVKTAVLEAVFKDKHITRVERERNEVGQIVQYGLTSEQMHYNSLVLRPGRHELLQEHTKAEALNGYREEEAMREGLLKEYAMVVCSGVAQDLPEKLLDHRGEGYFLHEMTYCIQSTTDEGDIMTETAFMAGTDAPEDATFDERIAQRFDIEVFGMVYEWLGLEAPKTVLEFLRNPVFIHKSLMPNGVVDFVRWCNQAKDILRGREVEQPIEQYIQMLAKSAEREASMDVTVDKVMQKLFSYAGTFKNPKEANDLLWELVKDYTVEASVTNLNINLNVFGPQAQVRLEKARNYAAQGDFVNMERWLISGHRFAVVSGCGGGSPTEMQDMLDARRAGSGDTDETWHGGEIHKNEKCNSCKIVKPEVGKCHICWDCMQHPAIMEATYKREQAEKGRSKGLVAIIAERVSNLAIKAEPGISGSRQMF